MRVADCKTGLMTAGPGFGKQLLNAFEMPQGMGQTIPLFTQWPAPGPHGTSQN